MGAWSKINEATRLQAIKGQSIEVTLNSLISEKGKKSPRLEDWERYIDFLLPIDCLGFLDDLVDHSSIEEVTLADLGTLMDITFLAWGVYAQALTEVRTVVEVGGGYGRLGIGFLQVFPESPVQWVLIDAVPAVLVQAFGVARKVLGPDSVFLDTGVPNAAISEKPRIVLTPSWGSELNWRLFERPFEFFVNIESFQEMDNSYVDFWCDFAGKNLSPMGFAYISNSRNYINLSPWNTPDHWGVQMFCETPRSTGVDHPSVVYSGGEEQPHPDRFSLLREKILSSRWRTTDDIFLRRSSPPVRLLTRLTRGLARLGLNPYRIL